MWIIIAALCATGIWFAIPFAWRKWSERQLAARCREQRAIVLTYDDGPGERLTEALASLLREYETKATFFVLGSRLNERPEIAQHLLAEGHEIGGHTMRHLNAWKSDPISVARDVSKCMRLVREAGGGSLFRPPYGKITAAGLLQAWLGRFRLGWWTVDSQDAWKPRSIDAVIDEIDRRGGGVVLMHDFDRYDVPIDHHEHVLTMTRRILHMAREKQFNVLMLRELLS